MDFSNCEWEEPVWDSVVDCYGLNNITDSQSDSANGLLLSVLLLRSVKKGQIVEFKPLSVWVHVSENVW